MKEKIIHFLKQSGGYVSGEEMSEQLKVSRSAVWKYIDQMRQDGYDIAAVPHLGYKLEAVPDKLLPHEIQFGLKTKIMGRHIVAFETAGSTMDEAFRLGMDGAPEGTVVCAEAQTKGRGRLGRAWASPKAKGVYCSLILRPQFSPAQMAQLTLMAAVALAEAIEKVSTVKARIKWPNDVLTGGRKLAGILTELRAEMDQVKFLVIGIGLNVNAAAGHLVPEATSLKMETGTSFDRVAVLQEILRSLEFWYGTLNHGGFKPVIEAWKRYSITLSKRVRVSDPGGTVEGVAFDLDSDGGLLIRQDSGAVIKKMAGDVSQWR
ncbi:MAG: biotin--[acetyl-CoA-carboxylase] ligase [Candidatus Omnitrophica bacterium]|nr:biotin--[acetyl-CoA-carboxylase] ligase [Candidatus Omnitrophota bacterium]